VKSKREGLRTAAGGLGDHFSDYLLSGGGRAAVRPGGFRHQGRIVALDMVAFSSLGAFVSVAVREVFKAQTLANFIRFPMIFL